MPQEYMTRIIEIASTSGIAMVGGLGHNLYLLKKGKKFTITMFILNILLAGFVGFVVGKFLPEGSFRDGILAISGFSSFPILSILEEKGADFILKKIGIDINK